ncbi:conserved hypothetical protein [Gammaproteobacteria bacterium]
MNDKFEKCMSFVLDREGRVYENDPNDPGGGTKFGISSKAYPNLSIINLTEQQAKDIYFRDYWTPMNCDQYEPRLALAVFDTAVNQGAGMAREILMEFGSVSFTAEQFLFHRLRHYSNLIQKKPNLERYCHNWMLRVIKVSEYKF